AKATCLMSWHAAQTLGRPKRIGDKQAMSRALLECGGSSHSRSHSPRCAYLVTRPLLMTFLPLSPLFFVRVVTFMQGMLAGPGLQVSPRARRPAGTGRDRRE